MKFGNKKIFGQKQKAHYFKASNYKYMANIFPFLGLRDKNGRIIYFGDILRDSMNNLLTPVVEIEHSEHIFYFKPIQNLDKPYLKMGCKSAYSDTLEIIGNIYENNALTKRFRDKCSWVRFSKNITCNIILNKIK